MADNVRKTNNRANGSGAAKTGNGRTGASAAANTRQAGTVNGKKTPAKDKPALQATNMNGRRNSGTTRTEGRKASGGNGYELGELEKRGYVSRRSPDPEKERERAAKRDDIIIIVTALICIIMVLSYIGICGIVGTGINAFIFGLFGRLGYILPFIILFLTLFIIANKDNGVKPSGVIYAVLLFAVLGALIQLAAGGFDDNIGVFDYFTHSSLNYEGSDATYGGLMGGLLVKLFCPFIGKVATVLILIALLLILFVLMTGKPFIMAVIRKIDRRISEYRKRRAIERNEQDIYEEEEPEEFYRASSASGVRYGVRSTARRRMGTMQVSFGKNGAQGTEMPSKEKKHKVKSSESIQSKSKTSKNENVAGSANNTNNSNIANNPSGGRNNSAASMLYIPGVGNVSLGKNSSDVIEQEYTDEDFAEVFNDNSGRGTDPNYRKSEPTRRKENEFNSNITELGVRKLHSGSIGKSAEQVTKIRGLYEMEEEENDNGYNDEMTEAGYDNKPVTEQNDMNDCIVVSATEDEKDYAENNTENYPDKPKRVYPDNAENIGSMEEFDEGGSGRDRRGDNIIPIKVKRDFEETFDDGKSDEAPINNTPIAPLSAKSSSNNMDPEAAKAAEQYSKATRIGSGAAVFTDMTKEPEKPREPEYVFPPISLLSKGKPMQQGSQAKKNELEATIQKLQSTFESFGVGVKVTDASVGPTVTRYELLPDQGVKVKTITSLSDDIKLALAAPEIRIEAPIPGKAAVGIEVPNKESAPVLFGDLIDTDEFRNSKSNLAFAVGKDIGGKSVVSDIGGMPHALIAGATGSGKSVCINALIMSILYKAKPSDVKMIMIDPKRVELVGYNGIPHLLVPVVTDVKKATGALNWAIAEMDDRYKRFAENGVTNLASYNNLMEERFIEEGGDGECTDKLPQILIIVDELNDLMMTANSKEVEADICRLTQLARACGIHVILATQRPSVNVITGTIKANIPTRIAFSVSSIVDSRTIIDQAGAEKLLGKGDMLFYPQGYAKPVRLQGAYVSDGEVAKVVKFIKEQYKEMKYSDIVSSHIEANSADKAASKDDGSQADPNAKDEYYEDAARLIIKKQKASVGMLQREFRIGFNRAARIMDSLAEDGIVGPEEGTKPRRIIMSEAEFEDFLNKS